jgi:CHASE2 domain-containing sensor protein/tRNA A-37 threonylcarbamoyl transferase component Bud32
MTPERWNRLKSLFNAALEKPTRDRLAFVRREAAGDEDLAREALALLATHEDDSFIEKPADLILDTLSTPGAALGPEAETSDLVDGKYRLEEQLGGGGMGVVYRARHEGLGKAFALKLIRSASRSDPLFAERFRTEAAALGRLKHPGIVDVTDFGIDPEGNRAYLVMEHLEGRTLGAERRERGVLGLDAALPVLEAAAQALDFAHTRGVLHLDLKPGNIFLSGDGPAAAVKILDFGLARLVATGDQQPAPVTAQLEGTPAYMAPESFTGGSLGAASDIYSFGIVAYELLTGRVPFQGAVGEVLQGHLRQAPPLPSSLNPELPFEIDAALLAALAKDPRARPSRAGDVVAGLRQARARATQRAWKTTERWRRLALAAAIGVALAAAGPGLSSTPAARRLERPVIDALFALEPPRAPDPRLLLVVIDEASLAADPTPLPERGEEAGRLLAAVLDAGAKAVAVDLLLPRQWGEARAFSDLVLERAEALTLAAGIGPEGALVGLECLDALTAAALGPQRVSALFGLVNVLEDEDGVTRKARLFVPAGNGKRRATWAGRAALAGGAGEVPEVVWVDAAVDPSRMARLSWKDLGARLTQDPGLFRDRLVLVGADYTGSGDEMHRVAVRRGPSEGLSGLELQALIVHTALAGRTYREPAPGLVWTIAGAALAFLLSALLYHRRLGPGLGGAAVMALLVAAAAAALFRARWLVPVAVPQMVIASAAVLGLVARALLPPFPVGGER